MNFALNHFSIDKKEVEQIMNFLPYPFLIAEYREEIFYNTYVNSRFLEEIGYTPEEIPTVEEWFVLAYPDEQYRNEVRGKWEELFSEAKAKREDSVQMKVIIRTKFNGDVWYEVKSAVFSTMQLIAFVNIQEAILREHELKQLNDNNNRTLSILTHDLRVPISNLHSLSNLLLSGHIQQGEFLKLVQQVNVKTFRVLELVDTTLLWTKSNFNQIETKVEMVDLDLAVKSILNLYENPVLSKKIDLSIEIDKDSSKFESDNEILSIVIRNILSNAIKFTHENGKIVMRHVFQQNHHIITIEDTGMGMTKEQIQSIFTENFHPTNGTNQEKGLGLGLKLCKHLLVKIGGWIEIKSEPNQGTLVTIIVPAS